MNYSNKLSLNTLQGEIWEPIKGYEGFYMVSNLGRIYTLGSSFRFPNGGLCIRGGKIKKLHMDKDGYLRVSLTKNHKQHTFAVHRLVAENFIPNTNNYPCIDHINGNRSDNSVTNLRWCTWKQNANFELAIKNRSKSSKFCYAKNPKISKAFEKYRESKKIKIWQYDLNGNLLNVFPSLLDAEKYSKNVETSCRKKDFFYHDGYIWSKYKIKDFSIFPYTPKTLPRKIVKVNIYDKTVVEYASIREEFKKNMTTKYSMIKLCTNNGIYNGYKYYFK